MRRRFRFGILLVVAIHVCLAQPGRLQAQIANWGAQAFPTSMGSIAMPTGQLLGTGQAPAKDEDPGISIRDTYVSILDSAVPRSVIGLRFGADYYNRQPMRAEYYHPKGGLPNSNGFPLIETRIDYQELTSFAEYSLTPWFSVFLEAPYRWINPEINANQSGAGDMKYGLRLCTWSSDAMIATILLRAYQPSARHETLGTGHWSIEPGLLAAYRIFPNLLLEGEARYWIPLGGSDFAGEVVRYGLGVSYGRKSSGLWYLPVVEAVGWTVLGGKTLIAASEDQFVIQDALGQTIVNGYLGLRWGHGEHLEFYAGYGRSFTGHFWQRELFRFEVRFAY